MDDVVILFVNSCENGIMDNVSQDDHKEVLQSYLWLFRDSLEMGLGGGRCAVTWLCVVGDVIDTAAEDKHIMHRAENDVLVR